MLAALLATFVGCNKDLPAEKVVRLSWTEGQEFHLASSHREIADMGELGATALDGGPDMGVFEELWSPETIWTYKVLHTDLFPEPGDELYPYSVNAAGRQVPLSVIKAVVDPGLNSDEAMLEMDPVVYLVFRQRRNRLAGIIQFVSQDGERSQQAFSSGDLGNSWSILSQSSLSMAPTYLAPHGMRWSGGERRLENGATAVSEPVDSDTVDVFFDDELGGELVAARYESGQPWPVWISTDNSESRLLGADELEDIRGSLPAMRPDEIEDFDYREALSSSLDLDGALYIDSEAIDSGGYDARVKEGYEPWAGSWWPLKKGELVFGYDGRETYSERVREELDPVKKDMDRLAGEYRDIEEDNDEKKAKRDEYLEKQEEAKKILGTFYDGIKEDMDHGKIRVEDGMMVRDPVEEDGETKEEGWSYEVSELSPMDKFALVDYLDGGNWWGNNPFDLPSWELLNSYNPGGESWWGHCNGWAAAAILANEPRESASVEVDGHEIEFTTADLKGLLTEAHYSTNTRFYGSRYNGRDGDDISDLSPANFLKIINFYIRDQGVPLVFDTTASEAVWNFPAWQAEVELRELDSEEQNGKIYINTADLESLAGIEGISEEAAKQIIEYREENGGFQSAADLEGLEDIDTDALLEAIRFTPIERIFEGDVLVELTTDAVDPDHVDGDSPETFLETWSFELVTDEDGLVLRGKWEDDNEHPDFAWVPYNNPRSASSSENPHLEYSKMLDLFGKELDRR
jgi:competence ComEA-like helix-hairpin-helix protein